ncbi:mediator of DNA damage checkpoint protein 1 [Anolis carolinensis]|uniref:Mediator of DNA damage checkpoint protein 1 n=1 Tax=Anolis carolinensis TaxID=28377 RepID=R4GBV4_ANOCA|nr:PREDICTED: mediator of DNA damage checkpoint protein 1 isoform X2 [Anolis carolinensis]|eukprot:XP_008118319.1 PREDICTED: mediator of DNA damage checkpoint protein 1 isoform X2 [Anolis carolinensis]
MEQTQLLDWDEEGDTIESSNGDTPKPVGRLHLLSSKYGPEKDFWIYPGENVIGRLESCQVCLPASSVSKAHAVIEVPSSDGPHLLYDKGSLNRTRRQRMVLIPQVRYSLQDGDSLIFGDVGCQYFMLTPEAELESPNDSVEIPPTQTRVEASTLVIEETPAPGRKMRMRFGGVLVQDSDKEEEEEVNEAGRSVPHRRGDGSVSSLEDARQPNLASSMFSSPSVVPESDEESGELSVSDLPCPSLHLRFESQDSEVTPLENGGPPPLDKEKATVQSGTPEAEPKGPPSMEEDAAEKQGAAPSGHSLVENLQLDSDTDVEDEEIAGSMSRSSGPGNLEEDDKALEISSDTDVDDPVLVDPDATSQKTHPAVIYVSSASDQEEVAKDSGIPKAQKTAENGDDDTDAEDGMENPSVVYLENHEPVPQMEGGCQSMGKAEEPHPKGSQPGENEDSDTDVEEITQEPKEKATSQRSHECQNRGADVDDTPLKMDNPSETLKTHKAALDSDEDADVDDTLPKAETLKTHKAAPDSDGDTDVEMSNLVLENSHIAQLHSSHPISFKDNDSDLKDIPHKKAVCQVSSCLDQPSADTKEVSNLNVQQQSSEEAVNEQSKSSDGKENPEIIDKGAALPQIQCLPALSVDSDTDVEEEEVEIQDVAPKVEHKPIVAGSSGDGSRSNPENNAVESPNSLGPIEVEDSDTDVEVVSPSHKESVAQDDDADVEEVVAPLPMKPIEEQETQLLASERSQANGEKLDGSAVDVRIHHEPGKEDDDTDAEEKKSCSGEESSTDDDQDIDLQATQCFLPSEPSSPGIEPARDPIVADSHNNLEEEPTQDFRTPPAQTRLLSGKKWKSPQKEEDSDLDAYALEATQAFCTEPRSLSEEPTQAFVVEEEEEIIQNTAERGKCSVPETQNVTVSATSKQQATSFSGKSTQPYSIGVACSEPNSETAVEEVAEECNKEEEIRAVQSVQMPLLGSSQPLTLQEVQRKSMTEERVCMMVPEVGSAGGGQLEERCSVPVKQPRDADQVPGCSKEEPLQPEASAPVQRHNLRSSLTPSPAPVSQRRSLRCRIRAVCTDTQQSEEPAAPVSRLRRLRQQTSSALYMKELEGKTDQPKEEKAHPNKKSKTAESTVTTRLSRTRSTQRESDATGRLKGDMTVAAGSPGTRELTRRGRKGATTPPMKKEEPELPQTRSSRRSNSSVNTPSPKGTRRAVKPEQDSPAQSTPSSGRRLRRQSTESKLVGMRSQPQSQSSVGSGAPSPKVLFTGVIDEEAEQVVRELGGSLAESVFDCTHLVTDRVCRTVKFLCALAQGIPIVTLEWLQKSRQNSFFLAPKSFLVRDPEQEKKFRFSLATSLRTAQRDGGLFQGYEIHVTPNVKPEPEHMRDIIKCSGGTYLPRMPRTYKDKRVIVSCPDDLPHCKPAQNGKVPITNSEFILTGILQQKIDLDAHQLNAVAISSPTTSPATRASKRRAVAQSAPAPPSRAKRLR